MMNWLTQPLRRLAGWTSKDPLDDYWYTDRTPTAASGIKVSEQTAMTFATVFACVSKLSKTVATLPIHVYRRSGDRRQQVDHWLAELLGGMANDHVTGMTVRESLMANLLLWGNAYLRETWNNNRDRVLEVEVLPSRSVTVKQDNDTKELVYIYQPDSEPQIPYDESEILHLRGLSLDGMAGLSPIAMNRQAVGLGMAATTFGESFFGNGAWFGGLITNAPDGRKLSKEAGEAFLQSLAEKFRGPSKAFGWGMLRESMDFKQIDMPFEDAMFLQTRQFQRTEICSIFDVPPALIQDHERSTFSNVEHQDIAFAKHSILPWCIRIEAALRARYLLTPGNLYVKHNLAGLQRGDFVSRMNGYAIGRQWGVYSINDCRQMEDLNPIPAGDDYLQPLNMQVVGAPPIVPVTPEPPNQSEPSTEDNPDDES